MNVILGINAFHADSAACLLVDGILIGAIAEERLGNRIKHSSEFPGNAIRRLLESAGLRLKDVTHLAIARDTNANLVNKIEYVLRSPISSAGAVREFFNRKESAKTIEQLVAQTLDEDVINCRFQVVNVEHHLAHIASAYYLSPYDSLTAGFSYDGSGDFASMMAARCEGNKIKILDRVALPNSMGFFYTALCQFIGFEKFGEEYKVMGLAPYGKDEYQDEMKVLIKEKSEGWFSLNSKYFEMHRGGVSGLMNDSCAINVEKIYTSKLIELLGPARKREEELTQRDKNIARSTQVRFEEISVHCINRLADLIPSNNLVMAGGCALNGVTNARLLKDTPFKSQFIQPASSDDGTCLGAAYYTWHQILGNTTRFEMKHAFWGPKYSDFLIEKIAKKAKYAVHQCQDDQELVERAARMIKDGLVVGWYQGDSEWGPRALGNRSILADPTNSNMKDIINSKIKRRESFRPFAPSVLKEDVDLYFEQHVDSPFMMHVVRIREEWRGRLPAVTHVDGTGRLQTVDSTSNFLYHKLISQFKRLSGVGILLNTSFNENEPVVDTPEQAYACFVRTEMDSLCMGKYIFTKT